MASLLAQSAPLERPGGIRVIAYTLIALGVYLLLNGALIIAGVVSLASGRYIVGEYATMGPMLFFIASALLVATAIGLLRGWRVSRRLAIIIAALLLATAVIPISAAFAYWQVIGILIHGSKIIVAVLAIQYLLRPEVSEFFSARSVR